MIEKLIEIIGIERVDDIPLLWEQLKTMMFVQFFDKHFPQHFNWEGELTPGEVIACWLCFIISTGNHRASHVQKWAEQRLQMLSALTGKRVRALDFSDDRLADLLARIGDCKAWQPFEQEFGGGLLRVYDLKTQIVRVDSTSAKTYAGVSESGLIQFGHSKDHRPDLAQVKISLATLDPLGLPVSTTVVKGNSADDPLYEPEITRVRETTGKRGLLYVGDQKIAAIETRAFIGGGGDYYLCPLGLKQFSEAERKALIEELFAKRQEPRIILNPETDEPIGVGFEITRSLRSSFTGGYRTAWTERILVLSSFERAQNDAKKLDQAIEAAQRELLNLNERKQGKKRLDAGQTAQACAEIVKRRGVEGIVNWQLETWVQEREVRAWKGRPERIEQESLHEVKVELDPESLRTRRQHLSWSFYATNHNRNQLPLERAILAYRGQHSIEQGFGRFKGRVLGLLPLFFKIDLHIAGLIHLLSIGLRLLCLVQFVVRRKLAEAKVGSEAQIKGLYPGQASRATTRPTTELMLGAFEGINMVIGKNEHGQTVARLIPLSELQKRILDLLGFSQEIYFQLVTHFQNLAPE
ncbi:MAG: IS1634 family transposase [Candidatus Binatia bacterium]